MNRETDDAGFLTSLSVIGEGLLRRACQLGVLGIEKWADIQAGGLQPLRKLTQK